MALFPLFMYSPHTPVVRPRHRGVSRALRRAIVSDDDEMEEEHESGAEEQHESEAEEEHESEAEEEQLSLQLFSRKLTCFPPTTTPHHSLLHLHQNQEWTTPPRKPHPVRSSANTKQCLTAHFPHNHLQRTNPQHPPTNI